jgi:N utilization substance protein A
VGVRGTRIKSIIDEVKGEKIDIIPWSDTPETLLADSLRPAEIHQITLEEGPNTHRATVTVPEDQLSLAIGWKGQNVRLAAKITGWDIDIVPPEPVAEEKPTAEEETSGDDAQEDAPETADESNPGAIDEPSAEDAPAS